jgi:RND family efflux transporter MFP subunit
VKGFLQSMHFEEGDFVDEGELLYVIDPAEFQAALNRARASTQVARASLELADARLQRMEQALKTNAVSEVDVLEARAQKKELEATVEARLASQDKAELDLSYTTIKAPTKGRVGRTYVDAGNLVGADENTLLTTLVRYDPMYAYFNMSERELLRIEESTRDIRIDDADRLARLRKIPLELGTSAERGYSHKGSLHYADQEVDASTGTYMIRGIFPNGEPSELIPGMFVRVRMPLGERENAVLVEERALGSDQSGRYVLVVDDQNTVHQRPVEIGDLVDGKLVIESGLEGAEWIVVEGLLRARPGAKVDPQRRGAEPAPKPKSGDTPKGGDS